MKSSPNKLFLFDRDGIINVRPLGTYVKNISEFSFHPDFFHLFRIINEAGYKTAVITNQQGIGKCIMTEKDLSDIHNYMQQELYRKTGYKFDKIYFCPSLEKDNDYRRKPNPGMIEEALAYFNSSPEHTFIIGDSATDVFAGRKAGINTIFINNENNINPDYHFYSLKEFIIYYNRQNKL